MFPADTKKHKSGVITLVPSRRIIPGRNNICKNFSQTCLVDLKYLSPNKGSQQARGHWTIGLKRKPKLVTNTLSAGATSFSHMWVHYEWLRNGFLSPYKLVLNLSKYLTKFCSINKPIVPIILNVIIVPILANVSITVIKYSERYLGRERYISGYISISQFIMTGSLGIKQGVNL